MEKITKSTDTVLIDPNEPLILPDGTALVGRIEWFLYALCCLDYQNLPTPMSRIEEFANALITGEIPNIEPQSRAEQFFLAILDGNVSSLPQPQSRSEVLLDKLARGEFDLSDVEPIQSRYELLLAYLIKNGGIGNIDYVLYEFSEAMKTMYNTVEKPFKSLELSGNTLVNCVLEDTENDDYTSFDEDYSGTSFTINGTSEGAIKSAILSGQTLVNVYDYTSSTFIGGATIENGVITFKANGGWVVINNKLPMLKPNTNYTIFVNILSNTLNSSSTELDYALRVEGDTGNSGFITGFDLQKGSVGIFKKLLTTKESLSTTTNLSDVRVHANANGGEIKFTYMIIEGDHTQEDIPYFDGMQSVKMPGLTTTGKNLYTGEQLMWTIDSNNAITTHNKESLFCFRCKPNTTYTFTTLIGNQYGRNRVHECYEEPKVGTVVILLKNNVSTNTTTITTSANAKYIVWQNFNSDNGTYTIEDLKQNAQIEENSVATSYEPYKSNILTVNEDVELRGVGNVKDELNVATGELTQRIGEIVLDGSNDEAWKGCNPTNDSVISFLLALDGKQNSANFTNNKMINKPAWNANVEGIWADSNIVLTFKRSTLTTNDLTGARQWLSQNPITVQYELATPIVKTVDLNVVDQNNTEIDKIHVFNEVTHVNASSDELTPTVNIGKSVSYPTIIKPNTKYTVDLKRNDKPLTVNLGGTEVTFASGETRKTITTPSTLTNDKLSYYGVGAKCNEIMLIEGEVERNVDYFTGMQSIVMQNQMPILTTVGKNLFDINHFSKLENWDGKVTSERPYYSYEMKLKPNTSYTFSRKENSTGSDIYFCISKNKGVYDWNGGIVHPTDTSANIKQKTITTDSTGILYFNLYQARNELVNLIPLLDDAQLEENTVATYYEPYKSSILSCNNDVTLRGIGDVKDELDLMTGELTQRIGEATFRGAENERWGRFDDSAIQEKTCLFSFYGGLPTLPKEDLKMLSDKYIIEKGYGTLLNTDEEMVHIYADKAVYFRILKSKLSTQNAIGLKEWLSQNPFTVQYQLKTESIKTVDSNVVDQDGNTIPKIKSYDGVTHLEVTVPKQSLLPNVSAEVATDNSKDMSSLTIKYQEISETQSAIQDNIQSQSDEIDTTLMATTEIFESILE